MNERLDQKKNFGKKQCYELIENHQVRVSVGSFSNFESWTVPLHPFNESPARHRSVDFKPMILVIPFGLMTIGSVVFGVIDLFQDHSWVDLATMLCMAFVFAVITGFLAAIITSNSVDVLTFTSSNGSRLAFWYNNPNPEKFESFVAAFKKAVAEAQIANPPSTTLAAEIQQLKDLLDRGILDKDQFESAKNRLTGNTSADKIGF